MNDIRLKKNSKRMMFIYGFLGLFMIFGLVVTNTAKPTYSANVCSCSSYGSGWVLTETGKCIKNTEDSVTCYNNAQGNSCTEYENNGYICTLVSSTAQGASYKCTKTTQDIRDAVCSWVASCYVYNHQYIWATSQSQAVGNSVNLSQSQCTGCTSGYYLSGGTCVEDTPAYPLSQRVLFDGNGGSGGGTKTCTITAQGGTCTVQAPPGGIKSGYIFNGWGTAQNCTSGTISADDYVTVAETSLHTYYACWQINPSNPYTPVKKTLVFDANGGSGGDTKQCTINIEGSYCTITTPSAPTRSGYTFKGWGTAQNCTSGTGAGNNILVYANSGTSYYACWEKNATPTGSCYINSSSHKFEWHTTDPGSGYTKSSKTQSACTGCAAPYTLEGDSCITHTASAAGCYKCSNTYLYYNSGETLGPACETTANANYIKPTGDGVSTDICIEKTAYQTEKTVTLTFVGTSTKTKSCTIAANANQCDHDLIAPTDIIDETKNFNGWGETEGCTAGSYTGNAPFRVTRASSNRTYYACYLNTDDKPNSDYDKSKCEYSMEAPVTRDVNHLYCTYTNISYNKDPNNITGDSTGNIKQCCLDHGYIWVDYNFTSSGWGYEYCIHCGGGTTTPERSVPVTSCYGCTVTNGTKYVYATSTSAAASATGGKNCVAANSSYCQATPTPVTSCYKCEKNGTDTYAYATSRANAATATGGTNCETVSDTYCAPKVEECYECTKTSGDTTEKYYTSVTDTLPSGTTCRAVDKKYCTNKHCYECVKGDTKKYTQATTITEAKKNTSGDSCKLVEDKYCKTPDNPKTGTTMVIIGWMTLIVCVTYGLWYIGKSKELNNK